MGGEWAGVLFPVEPGWRRVHLIGGTVSRALQSLAGRGPGPSGLSLADEARLILDGVFELEVSGRWLSGPGAHRALIGTKTPRPERGPLRVLSRNALRYGAALGSADPLLLAERLYRYHARPESPEWRRRFPTPDTVAQFLDSGLARRMVRSRRGRDELLESPSGRGAWRTWENGRMKGPGSGQITYKLYLSPDLASIPEALGTALAHFDRKRTPYSAKVGRDLPNLLRPDNLVLYFTTRDDLLESAARLRRDLAGMPEHGVPFTAAYDGVGLLSWATDPPGDAEPPGPFRRRSWRSWITARLGGALATALGASATVDPCRFAMDRLALDGVDTRRWLRTNWSDSRRPDADH